MPGQDKPNTPGAFVMDKPDTLEPCPFCGQSGPAKVWLDRADIGAAVKCVCGMQTTRFVDPDAATERWNTRTQPVAATEGVDDGLVGDISNGEQQAMDRVEQIKARHSRTHPPKPEAGDAKAQPAEQAEIEAAFREGFSLGDFAGGGHADPRAVDLAWGNSRARAALKGEGHE